jgi:hypothetical protein
VAGIARNPQPAPLLTELTKVHGVSAGNITQFLEQ